MPIKQDFTLKFWCCLKHLPKIAKQLLYLQAFKNLLTGKKKEEEEKKQTDINL